MKNTGLDIEREKLEQRGDEWIFGAVPLECLAKIPEKDIEKYLPKGELQFGREDFQDCASRGPLNILETKLNYLLKTKQLPHETWFRDNGYITENGFELSDRFVAILSKTTRAGNSIKAPIDTIRKNGVIPKRLLPARPDMTWEEYHNKDDITGSMMALGQNFLRHLSINYEKVLESQYGTFYDLLNVAGYAWPTPVNGVYPRFVAQPNHVWMNMRPKYIAFDNYLDEGRAGDFIKTLSPDFYFYEYGYRIIINKTVDEQYESILSKLIFVLKAYAQILSKSLKGFMGLSTI